MSNKSPVVALMDSMRQADPTQYMWEILVPTERPAHHKGHGFFRTRYHRVWDKRVRELTGGLTILRPAKGQWVSPSGELHAERMIPVRIIATREQIDAIARFTADYYSQEAVLAYLVSSEVKMYHHPASGT